jgi:SAM-dependent methyltransferase
MYHMRSMGWTVSGFDVNEGAVEVARGNGLGVRCCSIEDAAYADCSFDLVHLGDVIEHLPAPGLTMQKIHSWLRPGGLLIMRTPDVRCGFARASAWIGRVTRTQWAHAEAPYHLTEFSPEGLRRLSTRTGFDVLEIVRSGRISFAYRVGASGYFDALKADLKCRRRPPAALLLPKVPALAGVSLLVGIGQLAAYLIGGADSMTVVGRKLECP